MLDNLDMISTYSFFECLINEYPQDPTSNLQTPILNPFRNYKQNTQKSTYYTYCTKSSANTLNVEIPRGKNLNISNYYELVVMPVGVGIV
jgi:hypothetical protein